MGKELINDLFNHTNPIDILLIAMFIYPILKGFLFKFSSKHLKKDVRDLQVNVSFVISIILGIYFMKNIFFNHSKGIYKKIYEFIPVNIINYINKKPIIVYVIAIPIAVFIIHYILTWILEVVSGVTLYPLFDGIERKLKGKSSFIKRILGSAFQFPKAICYVIITAFVLNLLSMFNISQKFNHYLESSKKYNYVCKQVVIPITNSKLAKRLPNIINNSFKIVIKKDSIPKGNVTNSRTIVYYNGVTLDEGIKSNSEINTFAKELVSGIQSDRQKGKKIYNWIAKNISYDNDKAEKIFRNEYDEKSGAIPTYYSRSGICFDYACLFVAMCRANNIKVRLITGKGFNGVSWVGHAWNQIYVEEEGKWINVDATFAKGGNYFDSRRFALDHKQATIAGEW
ncbi:transglutaminase domain-containing protein [Haloimpatiens sp. FM7330]|uniref:transglutaminase domain-containing protein n=1 Tax=Haloimpatiens sp. FM7330 TaxID=3298610 RepID=UPI003632AEA0